MLWLLVGVLFVIGACNLPQGKAPPSGGAPLVAGTAAQTAGVPPAVLTAAAGTAMVSLTQTAVAHPTPAATPTLTPSPTFTLTPTLTATPTLTLTPTPSTPHISVSVNTNCRTGPGDAYPRVGALLVGETAEVLARDPYGQFWYIPNPDRPGGYCWVWGQYATIEGETASLPVFTPPPTPTPVPDFTIDGVTMKNCCGPDYFIKIVNTGALTWKSYRVDVTDLTTNTHAAEAKNAFAPSTSICGPILSVQAITSGHSAYISYYPPWGDTTHDMRFMVTLYENDGQTGRHVTKTVEYHP